MACDPGLESWVKKDISFPSFDKVYTKSADSLPFENESLDLITMLNSLDHAYNPKECVDDVYRVLRKGGRVYFSCEIDSPHNLDHPSNLFEKDFNRFFKSFKLIKETKDEFEKDRFNYHAIYEK